MGWRWTPVAVLSVVGAIFFLAAAWYVWRRRLGPEATSLILVLLAVTEWSLCYAVELSAPDLVSKELWGDLKYVGICTLPPAWFAFTFQYTGRGHLVTLRSIAPLLIHPIVTLVLLANPETHDLIRYYPPGADLSSAAEDGPLYWGHLAYVTVVIWACTGMLVAALSRVSRVYRRQALILSGSLAVPFLLNLLFSFELIELDLSPFGFSVTCVVLVWGLFRFRLLDITPLARSSLFELMRDAALVLDAYHRVVDLNPAAARALGMPRKEAVGKAARQLLPGLARLADQTDVPGDGVVTIGEGDEARYWELTGSTLHGPDGRPTGWLLVLRDVTERRLAAEQIRQVDEARRALLAHVVEAQEQERRRIASDIHDDSIQAMAAAIMRLQLVRKRSQDADQLEKIDALELALSQAIERLRSLLFNLRPPVLDELGLAAALRQYLEQTEPEGGWRSRVVAKSRKMLSEELRVTAYRIAQEAISNARRHSRARRLLVEIEDIDGGVRVRVRDDGDGFVAEEGVDTRPGHLGMAGMRERASMAGGWWRLDSRPGRGTTVEFWLPVPDTDRPAGRTRSRFGPPSRITEGSAAPPGRHRTR